VIANIAGFDNIYLGAKSSVPTANNSGGSLVEGSLYYDDVGDSMKVWDGTAWLNAYASLSGALIAANNLNDLANVTTARASLGLGTAATTDASAYATASQADQTVVITGSGAASVSGTYPNFTIGSTNTTYTGGTGLSLIGTEFTNTSPDQTVVLTGGGTTTVTGTYPNFAISSSTTIPTGSVTTATLSPALAAKITDLEDETLLNLGV
jgi:hypothetical protein